MSDDVTAPSVDNSLSERMFNKQLASRRFYVGSGLALLVLGASLLGFAVLKEDASEAFRFIGLIMIAMSGLATTAAVFVGLRLGNREEAFGLPVGSIRALLAFAVMILFVVFALPVVDPEGRGPARLADTPTAVVSLPPGKLLVDEIKRYEAQGFVVVVTNYGAAAKPGVGTTAPAAEVPAEIKLFQKTHAPSREAAEARSQLITALVTLLTSVVSFYFGSKSVLDTSRQATATGTSKTIIELATQSKALADKLKTLTADEAAWQRDILAAQSLPLPINAEEQAAWKATLADADKALADYGAARDAARTGLAAADKALETARADVDDRTRPINEAEAKRMLDLASGQVGKVGTAVEVLRAALIKITPAEG